MVDKKRIRILKGDNTIYGSIVYWMSRDQRINDNWALLFAQELAREKKAPLASKGVPALIPESGLWIMGSASFPPLIRGNVFSSLHAR
jgi:hypothetical protein